MDEIDSYRGELLSLPAHTNMKTDPPKVPMSDPVSTIVDIMISARAGGERGAQRRARSKRNQGVCQRPCHWGWKDQWPCSR